MGDFDSPYAFERFAKRVRTEARYVFDQHTDIFLSTLLATSQKRRKLLSGGSVYFRAQLGCGYETRSVASPDDDEVEFEEEVPSPADRMKPLASRAQEGRLNPKGIPYLYLATNAATAIGEVRPGVGTKVSLAEFVLTRDIAIVDCCADQLSLFDIDHLEDELSAEDCERLVWSALNKALAMPVTRADDVAEYAPTQVIAEAFRSDGCDGVLYNSSCGSGASLALFDLEAADLRMCGVYQIESVKYSFDLINNPYYRVKYYPQIASHWPPDSQQDDLEEG